MPLPPADARPLWAVGARRRTAGRPTARELVDRIRELARAETPLVALLDARAVAGERHLLSAWAHLGRARERGEARLRDRGAEFLLFVAGDDQLPRALHKVGIQPDSELFVLAAERPREPTGLLDRLELVEAPEAYPRAVDAALLERLGVSPEERSALPPTSWEALVLERVALLELSAPHAAPSAERRGPSKG